MRAQVVAHGVAVFDHPLCRGQDKGTLAESARPDSIEFSCDRVNGCRRPTMLCVHGCRGVLGVLLAGPGGAVRAQGAHGGGEQPGFGRDVPPIPQGVQPAIHPIVGAVGAMSVMVVRMARTWAVTSNSATANGDVRQMPMPNSATDFVTYLAK